MKIGLFTNPLANVPLEKLIPWASGAGFDTLVVDASPLSAAQKDASGIWLEPENLNPDSLEKIRQLLASNVMTIDALNYKANLLHYNPNLAHAFKNHLMKVIDTADILHIGFVSTYIGRNMEKSIAENMNYAAEIFLPILEYAGQKQISILFENDPRFGWDIDDLPGNLCYSPDLWHRLLEKINVPNVGFSIDLAHFHRIGVDELRILHLFKEHIKQICATDYEILNHNLADVSYFGKDWYRPRIAGFGELAWNKILDTLYQTRFEGAICLDNQDYTWLTDEKKVKQGLLLGKRQIMQYII